MLALSYFVIDKVVFNSGRDTAGTSTADQVAQQQPAEIESAKADNSIAVLPFVNMSSDEEQEYFSDGLSEELLNLLARIPELKVAARTSSFSFKGQRPRNTRNSIPTERSPCTRGQCTQTRQPDTHHRTVDPGRQWLSFMVRNL